MSITKPKSTGHHVDPDKESKTETETETGIDIDSICIEFNNTVATAMNKANSAGMPNSMLYTLLNLFSHQVLLHMAGMSMPIPPNKGH